MRGIGDDLQPVPELPPCWLVLVNPRVPVPTGAVFGALERREGAPMPATLPRWPDAAALAAWLAAQRNDLEPAARRLAPEVDAVLAALGGTEGCLLTRMSGSGATCFGFFAGAAAAEAAAARLAAARPGWWVRAAAVLRAPPEVTLAA